MNPLGLSFRERLISRVCFYLVVLGIMWLGNRVLPVSEPGVYSLRQDPLVAPAYIAVPISEVSFAPVSR
ncbi:MAG: hypothetical protein AAGA96_10985 [Verrucomicrobiota bacterium]